MVLQSRLGRFDDVWMTFQCPSGECPLRYPCVFLAFSTVSRLVPTGSLPDDFLMTAVSPQVLLSGSSSRAAGPNSNGNGPGRTIAVTLVRDESISEPGYLRVALLNIEYCSLGHPKPWRWGTKGSDISYSFSVAPAHFTASECSISHLLSRYASIA